MKIMYIFPHPDDESFGPAAAINRQISEGNEVILLTFTKGGATKVRHQLGLDVAAMGLIREKELKSVQSVLGISEMTILDYEDGGLSKVNPIEMESELKKWIVNYRPDIVVTYPVHGGSGHHDHIALHHSIRRLFYEKGTEMEFWKRLAYFTVIDTGMPMFLEGGVPRVIQTKQEDVAVDIDLESEDIEAMTKSLSCYETYQQMLATTNVIERIGKKIYYELEQERFIKPLKSLTQELLA